MRIYVASSWRNPHQPWVVSALWEAGHEVYDFRNPSPGDNGFRWSEIDPEWETWRARAFRDALNHPVAREGFRKDMEALKRADVVVLVTALRELSTPRTRLGNRRGEEDSRAPRGWGQA